MSSESEYYERHNALVSIPSFLQSNNDAIDGMHSSMKGGLAVLAAGQQAQLAVSSVMAAELEKSRQLQQGILDGQQQLVEITTKSVQIQEAMREDLAAGFASLNNALDSIENTIDEGFARVERALARVESKIEWSDSYKRFLAFKKRAIQLLAGGDPIRALEQATTAISVLDAQGFVDDDVARDPQTNYLVAQLQLRGIKSGGSLIPPSVEECARRAYEKGKMAAESGDKQAAAEGAHILAIVARQREDFAAGAEMDLEAWRLEQQDDIRGLARALSALTLVADAEQVSQSVALAAIAHPRFFLEYLVQPALLCSGQRSEAVLKSTTVLVRDLFNRAYDNLRAQEQSFRELPVHEVADAPRPVDPAISPDAPLIVFASATRALLDLAQYNLEATASGMGRAFHKAGLDGQNRINGAYASLQETKNKANSIDAKHTKAVSDHLSVAGLGLGVGCLGPIVWAVIAVFGTVVLGSCGTASRSAAISMVPLVTGLVLMWSLGRIGSTLATRFAQNADDANTKLVESYAINITQMQQSLAQRVGRLKDDLTAARKEILQSRQSAALTPNRGVSEVGLQASKSTKWKPADPRSLHQLWPPSREYWLSNTEPALAGVYRGPVEGLLAFAAVIAQEPPKLASPVRSSYWTAAVALVFITSIVISVATWQLARPGATWQDLVPFGGTSTTERPPSSLVTAEPQATATSVPPPTAPNATANTTSAYQDIPVAAAGWRNGPAVVVVLTGTRTGTVRDQGSFKGKAVDEIAHGTLVNIVGKSPDNIYHSISYQKGGQPKSGWMHRDVLRPAVQ